MSKGFFLYQYIDVIKAAFGEGKSCRITAIGSSMEPNISEGDSIVLIPPADIVRGDILLYRISEKNFALHRVLALGDILKCAGDNNIIVENVRRENVIAMVSSIEHAGNVIYRGSRAFRKGANMSRRRRFWRRVKNKLTR